ncbi:MAG: hypothetical protein J6X99_07475 [Bacteroidales bacterium]|nr:hypothetical protein [Bacteroidales bacterium]
MKINDLKMRGGVFIKPLTEVITVQVQSCIAQSNGIASLPEMGTNEIYDEDF